MARAAGAAGGRRTLIASQDRPQWWLEQAGRAARQIPDAPIPTHVRVHCGPDTYAATRRVGAGTVVELVVAKTHLDALTGSRAGAWTAAAAAARARWPRRAQRHGSLGPVLLLLAAGLSALYATSASASTQTVLWSCAAMAGAVSCGGWVWWRRRRDCLIAWSGDDQAVRLVGMEAARDALDDVDGPGLYRTAVHDWWAARDSLRSTNRLARLERRLGGGQ